jgi:hypothetical protein
MRQKGAGNAASLNLEAPAVPPSSCLLKLPALCTDIWLGVAVRDTRSFAKVPNSFPGVLGTPQENRVLSKRRALAASNPWLFLEASLNRLPRTRKFEVAHPSRHCSEEQVPAGLDAPCPIGTLDLACPAPVVDFVVHERS